MSPSALEIAQGLIRCRSVTPCEGGALTYLQDVLKRAGFETHRIKFSEPDMPDIDNLYAKIGSGTPHFVFAGHTDVVPPGDETRWKHGAFSGEVSNGVLYGRGAVDMKGAIACFAAAALDFLAANRTGKGTISFLITGDEEGPAVNGTAKLLKWAAARGEQFDHCVVGEPTSVEQVGDTIKIGRRGSLSGTITVTGKSGHAAYPDRAENPIRTLVNILQALQQPLDDGSYHFQKSNLEVVSVDVGNAAFNVIPGEAQAKFNVRFNDNHTVASLKQELLKRSKRAAGTAQFRIDWEPPSDVFVTKPGPFVDMLCVSVAEVTGRKPQLSTSGGTSDARFIKDHCEVVDLGLVGQTMHQTDENTPVADLELLTAIYRRVLDRYFK